MYSHSEINGVELTRLIRGGKITFAGNRKLRIYGTLHCGSGKRMKTDNRVFFETEAEAIQMGYRPCGNCLRKRKRKD
jgi:methylphosphotriester-DNA--protein-cysteine methyltransferase